jgi:DNA-directed RNA polymerase subunit RPC12/RpoP
VPSPWPWAFVSAVPCLEARPFFLFIHPMSLSPLGTNAHGHGDGIIREIPDMETTHVIGFAMVEWHCDECGSSYPGPNSKLYSCPRCGRLLNIEAHTAGDVPPLAVESGPCPGAA